jgi:hypothetical protein
MCIYEKPHLIFAKYCSRQQLILATFPSLSKMFCAPFFTSEGWKRLFQPRPKKVDLFMLIADAVPPHSGIVLLFIRRRSSGAFPVPNILNCKKSPRNDEARDPENAIL